jgi:hypothetical protein
LVVEAREVLYQQLVRRKDQKVAFRLGTLTQSEAGQKLNPPVVVVVLQIDRVLKRTKMAVLARVVREVLPILAPELAPQGKVQMVEVVL